MRHFFIKERLFAAKNIPNNILGYTLFELLLTTSFLIILTTSATFSYNAFLQRKKLLSVCEIIKQELLFAQRASAFYNSNIIVKPNNNNWRNGFSINNGLDKIKEINHLAADNIHWQGFMQTNSITIFPPGMTYNNGHFVIYSGKKNCFLYLNNALKVRYECRR